MLVVSKKRVKNTAGHFYNALFALDTRDYRVFQSNLVKGNIKTVVKDLDDFIGNMEGDDLNCLVLNYAEEDVVLMSFLKALETTINEGGAVLHLTCNEEE